MDAVDAALATVSKEAYVLQPDGRILPQTSSPAIIASMLRLLEVQRDTRVLEIGTGSGYSTALLSDLVGPNGFVLSIDIDPLLVERANRLFRQHGARQARAVASDGRLGYPDLVPFHRVVSWATAKALPHAWVEQVELDGLIVAPVQLAPLAGAIAVARARCSAEHEPVGEQIIHGGFTPLADTPVQNWANPPDEADVVAAVSDEVITWSSSQWLRNGTASSKAQHLELLQSASSEATLLHSGEDVNALRAYLFALQPEGLTTARTQATQAAFGCSVPGSLALLSLRQQTYVRAGATAAATLTDWIEGWRAHGCPNFTEMHLNLEKSADSWTARATLPL
jgi:protein-L-isoaspartate(D-aspartate) O-methyltransferase